LDKPAFLTYDCWSIQFFEEDEIVSRLAMPLLRFLRSEQGPTAVEYALVLALIVVACVIAIGALGTSVTKPFKKYSKSACIWPSASDRDVTRTGARAHISEPAG
jgi:pilus assembly protein Flp/PilA